MAKYIPLEPVVAEIERRRDLHYKYYMENGVGSIAEYKYDEDREILSFINTLEVKDVELEKEIDKIWKTCNPIDEGMGCAYIDIVEFNIIAKHFFELGIAVSNKALKGK